VDYSGEAIPATLPFLPPPLCPLLNLRVALLLFQLDAPHCRTWLLGKRRCQCIGYDDKRTENQAYDL
jgi:hypothetical protein